MLLLDFVAESRFQPPLVDVASLILGPVPQVEVLTCFRQLLQFAELISFILYVSSHHRLHALDLTEFLLREAFYVVLEESLDLLGMSEECLFGSSNLAVVQDKLSLEHIHSNYHIIIVLVVDQEEEDRVIGNPLLR